MRSFIFANRNFKEITRDPASMIMSIGFPVLLILALSLMKQSIGGMADIFEVGNFTPSMMVFGLSFFGMFVGSLMSTDNETSFLMRLFASPLTAFDYIIGYSLPVLPLALIQGICCFITAFFFGQPFNANIILTLIVLIPIAVLFIACGLFIGSVFSSGTSVSGFSTILVNAVVFLGGAVIPLDLVGGIFKTICYLLPFAHANDAVKAALAGEYSHIIPHLLWVSGYAVVLIVPAIFIFRKKMKGQGR